MTFIKSHSTSKIQQYNRSPPHFEHVTNSRDFVHLKPKTMDKKIQNISRVSQVFLCLLEFSLKMHRIL